MPTLGWLMGGVVVLTIALVAALVPRRLLADTPPYIGLPLRRLPATALVAGFAVYAVAAALFGWTMGAALGGAASVLAALALIDARYLIIPDIHAALLVGLALFGPLALPLPTALLGATLGGGLLWSVRAAFRARGVDGLGFGDVKLMAALGALAGPRMMLWILVAGCGLGIAWGLARSRGRLPGGPPMPFGTLVSGPALVALALAAGAGR